MFGDSFTVMCALPHGTDSMRVSELANDYPRHPMGVFVQAAFCFSCRHYLWCGVVLSRRLERVWYYNNTRKEVFDMIGRKRRDKRVPRKIWVDKSVWDAAGFSRLISRSAVCELALVRFAEQRQTKQGFEKLLKEQIAFNQEQQRKQLRQVNR